MRSVDARRECLSRQPPIMRWRYNREMLIPGTGPDAFDGTADSSACPMIALQTDLKMLVAIETVDFR
ncbi:hypothetical protein AYJ54_17870 [Bradyrhizobium centrolobii]|uniref:Uncharacterized protein n=1 Tax=Bradyrhizobium centrolobii TaxID=1505087 RepID=A0A176YJN8_9BRAD|nr:hypothetical protein AYJ54_17870 [Bradyrhizobium centrolobii]